MTLRFPFVVHAALTIAFMATGGLTYCPALLPPLSDGAAALGAPHIAIPAVWNDPGSQTPPATTRPAAATQTPPATTRPAAATQTPPATTRPAAATQTPPAEAPADSVERILRTLELSAQDLTAFTASIYYETEEAFLGQKVSHRGSVLYTVEPATKKKSFAILFDTTIEDNRKVDRKKHYVIKDGWLAEIDHENRQFIKRQLVRPDENFDPLKLGEGPIPLPIGQPADEVLARFDVTLLDLPATGPLRRKVLGDVEVDGLLLVPKAGTNDIDDFKRIELFYDRKTHLPVGVNVIEPNGDRKTARLSDLRRNPVLDEAMLKQLSIERPVGDWDVDIRALGR